MGRRRAGTAADGRHLAWTPTGRRGGSQRLGNRFAFAGAPLREEWRASMPLHNNMMPYSILYVFKRRFRCPTSQYQDALLHS